MNLIDSFDMTRIKFGATVGLDAAAWQQPFFAAPPKTGQQTPYAPAAA